MARLNDSAQWIVLMGFIISVGIFFLAVLINQSMLVGQTTAESVLEFPKSDLQDLRNEIHMLQIRYDTDPVSKNRSIDDITAISMSKKTALVQIDQKPGSYPGEVVISHLHYNNGITNYDEEIQYWDY